MSKILIVEDEAIIRTALRKLLERHGYDVSVAGSVQEAQQAPAFTDCQLIISDLRLPGAPGTDLIKLAPKKPVLIMTSYASLRSAVDAMKLGAVDYIAKPFDHDEMTQKVQGILAEAANEEEPIPAGKDSGSAHEVAPDDFSKLGIIGSCQSMVALFSKLSKVAPTNATVLIQGESGTGKELVARAIHQLSHRSEAPMISVNCAAIPETLIESELFGHEKGAFTGATAQRQGLVEAAEGGTLFLDEIGELPLEAQARLLRVLQESEIRRVGSVTSKKVDVRLVAATHRDLKQLSKNGQFREDLYYRLNVMELQIPALRDRGTDVIELAKKLLEKACDKLGRSSLSFSGKCLKTIEKYQWPGNVRELENSVERAVILCDDGQEITADLLGIDYEIVNDPEIPDSLVTENAKQSSGESPQDLSLEDYFQHFVLENQEKMSETELAQKLGVSRKCLWERRQRLGIPRTKKAQAS